MKSIKIIESTIVNEKLKDTIKNLRIIASQNNLDIKNLRHVPYIFNIYYKSQILN